MNPIRPYKSQSTSQDRLAKDHELFNAKRTILPAIFTKLASIPVLLTNTRTMPPHILPDPVVSGDQTDISAVLREYHCASPATIQTSPVAMHGLTTTTQDSLNGRPMKLAAMTGNATTAVNTGHSEKGRFVDYPSAFSCWGEPMAKQLSMCQIQSIITLHRSGHSNRKIAELLGIHRETVGSSFAHDGEMPRFRSGKSLKRPTRMPLVLSPTTTENLTPLIWPR